MNKSMQKYELVEASAGSGKTTALVVRYLSLLFMGESSNEILALTFTNKATKEMKDRIVNMLYNLKNEPLYLQSISDNTNLEISEILDRQKLVLLKFLQEPNFIMTIDKFLNKILRLFCFYDGINLDFTVKENISKASFINFYISSLDYSQIKEIIKLNNILQIDMEGLFGIFFILLEKSYNKLDIIDNTFIIDNNLEEYIFNQTALLKQIVLDNTSSSNSAKNAFENIQSVEDIMQKTWATKLSLKDYSYFKKIYIPHMDEIFLKLKLKIKQYCKQKEIIVLSGLLKSFNVFKANKQKYQKIHNELSFTDVTNGVYNILHNNIDKEFLYFRLDSKISHILIDEFQDTSSVQFMILKPLIDEILSGLGKQDNKQNRTLYFVGDAKQSLYRFRGASKELMDKLAKNDLITTSTLSVNYRSSINIVDLVNKTFVNLFENYSNQQSYIKEQGFTSIKSFDQDVKSDLLIHIKTLLQNGYKSDDIAILSFKNKDLITFAEWIKSEFKDIKIITDTTSRLVNNLKVKAIMNFIYFCYFGDTLYLKNFSSLISYSDISRAILKSKELNKKYKKDKDLQSLVLAVIIAFDLYDENTMLFLQRASSFKDIIDFVYNAEDIEDKASNTSLKGLRLMTIHKAKGLAFKNVILIEQLSKDRANTNKLLFEYDNSLLKTIHLKTKLRENFDENYKNSLAKESKSSRNDLINVLYVAMTRARDNLFILKSINKSKFDILSLQDNENGEIKKHSKEIHKIIEVKKTDNIVLKNYGTQEDFLRKEEREDIEVQSIVNIHYGNAVHFLFENLYNLEISSIDFAYELTKNKFGFYLNDNILENIKTNVEKCILHKEFQALIKDKTIKKEVSFTYNKEIGIIDLLLEDENDIYIVDYKSSSSSKKYFYTSQIEFYKKSLGSIYNKKIRGYLYFINESILEEVL